MLSTDSTLNVFFEVRIQCPSYGRLRQHRGAAYDMQKPPQELSIQMRGVISLASLGENENCLQLVNTTLTKLTKREEKSLTAWIFKS